MIVWFKIHFLILSSIYKNYTHIFSAVAVLSALYFQIYTVYLLVQNVLYTEKIMF